MGYMRANRIAGEIKKIVSLMIMNDLKDPRISSLTSIVEVKVTRDLRYANIFVSVFGNEKQTSETIEALNNSSGFVRREIGRALKLRYTPEPIFENDNSIKNGMYISGLIKKVKDGNDNE